MPGQAIVRSFQNITAGYLADRASDAGHDEPNWGNMYGVSPTTHPGILRRDSAFRAEFGARQADRVNHAPISATEATSGRRRPLADGVLHTYGLRVARDGVARRERALPSGIDPSQINRPTTKLSHRR